MAAAALDRLKLFGVPAREIARLQCEGTTRDAVEVDSPMTGYVVERNALPNMYASPIPSLYAITTLSNIWIYAAVFQNQIGQVKVGNPVAVTVDAYPGRSFEGRVDFIWEAMDPSDPHGAGALQLHQPRRTAQIGYVCERRDHTASGTRAGHPGHRGLSHRRTQCGLHRPGDGYLTPTEVELGAHLDHNFQVLKGLNAGERIVSSANFLIDSESQLQAACGTFVPPPPGVSAAAGHPETAGPARHHGHDYHAQPGRPRQKQSCGDAQGRHGQAGCRRAGFGDVLYGGDAFDGDGCDEGPIDAVG